MSIQPFDISCEIRFGYSPTLRRLLVRGVFRSYLLSRKILTSQVHWFMNKILMLLLNIATLDCMCWARAKSSR